MMGDVVPNTESMMHGSTTPVARPALHAYTHPHVVVSDPATQRTREVRRTKLHSQSVGGRRNSIHFRPLPMFVTRTLLCDSQISLSAVLVLA